MKNHDPIFRNRWVKKYQFSRLAFLALGFMLADPVQAGSSDQSREELFEEKLARVFLPDPLVAAGSPFLSPFEISEGKPQTVELARLIPEGGFFSLKGKYLEVLKGKSKEAYREGAQEFLADPSDPLFQGGMCYYFGDLYSFFMDQLGLFPDHYVLKIIDHLQMKNGSVHLIHKNGIIEGLVKLGEVEIDSKTFSLDNDAQMIIHEMQHGFNALNYSLSPRDKLSQFWSDEGGVLDEGISDFMALLFTERFQENLADPRIFGKWSLGMLTKGKKLRGAHACPSYDTSFPECRNFPDFGASSEGLTVSYVYPDGLGWPFAGLNLKDQKVLDLQDSEDIHQLAIIVQGTLWDLYTDIKTQMPKEQSRILMTKITHEVLQELSLYQEDQIYPRINLIDFFKLWFANVQERFSPATLSLLRKTLQSRGFLDYPKVETNWSVGGAGVLVKNFKISSKESPLKPALVHPNLPPLALIPIAGEHQELLPDSIAAIWFDIKNDSEITVGGVLNTVKSLNSWVHFLGPEFNRGVQSKGDVAQIIYSKINGKHISNAFPHNLLPSGNSYFETQPSFSENFRTALWVKVDPKVPAGSLASFEIHSLPTNGEGSSTRFDVKIH